MFNATEAYQLTIWAHGEDMMRNVVICTPLYGSYMSSHAISYATTRTTHACNNNVLCTHTYTLYVDESV